MAEKVIAASLELDDKKASASVKSFKTQLREAQQNLIQLQEQFGPTSQQALVAARSVAELRDRMEEAREVSDLYDPGKKFAALGNVLRTVAGGMTALTGTMSLLGMQGEDTEKALLKVQSALAVTEGLNTVFDSIKDFRALKVVAVDAFNSIKVAIGSTGIGAILLAVGLLVTYWDDIKEAVSGVSEEERKNLETATELANKEKEKINHLGQQDNILKLQGASEREILQIKEKALEAGILASENELTHQKLIQDVQVATAKRNHDILVGLINLTTVPLKLLTGSIDMIAEKFGKHLNLTKYVDGAIDSAASIIFDADDVRAKADEANKEAQDGIDKMRDQLAGFRLQEREMDKKAVADQRAFQKQLKDIRKEADNAYVKDAALLARERLDQENQTAVDAIKNQTISLDQKNQLLLEQQRLYNAKSKVLDDERLAKMFISETEAAQKLIDKQKRFDDQMQKSKQSAGDSLQSLVDISNEISTARLDAAGQQYAAELAQLDAWHRAKLAGALGNAKAIAEIDAEYERQRTILSNNENSARLQIIISTLSQAADLFGKASVAGKILAIASATIETYLSAQRAYSAMVGIPVYGPVLAPIAAGIAVAAGLANIRRIVATQVPGATGGSMPSIAAGAQAPLTPRPQVTNTLLPADQINEIGNAAAAKVFVLESDVTNNQERIARLNRAARLGG